MSELEDLFLRLLEGYRRTMSVVIRDNSEQPGNDLALLEVECAATLAEFKKIVEKLEVKK